MKKNAKPFYVIVDNVNTQRFEKYDVMKYFIRCYNNTDKENKPTTFEEFKSFIERWSRYMYWSRCEYEVILKSWAGNTKDKKIDVHWQIMNNIDIVTNILIQNVAKSKGHVDGCAYKKFSHLNTND